jgi:CPA2 family monovalent cation:H+ antiporter-2
MHSELLQDLVVIFAVAVVVVAALRRLGVPAIAGFIVAGVLVGPNVLRVIPDPHEVELLAEIGVALLLFGIGLELSLDRVRRLWRPVLIGGGFQVLTTAAIATATLAGPIGFQTGSAILLGCVIAISSTAVVLSALRTRGELDAPHGRLTLGILVFQDLCVVPMILVIPMLAGEAPPSTLVIALVKAVAVIAAVILGARLIVPRLLHTVARTRQRELFVLTVFLVCVGTAWMVSSTGVSLALGAFLAGLVVAGSEYRHQAMSDLVPFREVFTSLFFVSVGMLLDPAAIVRNALPIGGLLAALVVGKAVIASLAGVVLRMPFRVSILAGIALAQVGEFSFVLLSAARAAMSLPQPFTDNLTVAVILSMLITPLLIALAPKLAAGVGRMPVLTRVLEVNTPGENSERTSRLSGHVIVAGYGLTGHDLAQSLEQCGVPYVIVDINAENVRRAIQHNEPAYFGDVTSPEVLESLGAKHARELVIAINDIGATERAVRAVRACAPDLPVVVRAQYAIDVERLIHAGATEVVAAELSASAEVTQRVLHRCGVSDAAVAPQIDRIRSQQEDE